MWLCNIKVPDMRGKPACVQQQNCVTCSVFCQELWRQGGAGSGEVSKHASIILNIHNFHKDWECRRRTSKHDNCEIEYWKMNKEINRTQLLNKRRDQIVSILFCNHFSNFLTVEY